MNSTRHRVTCSANPVSASCIPPVTAEMPVRFSASLNIVAWRASVRIRRSGHDYHFEFLDFQQMVADVFRLPRGQRRVEHRVEGEMRFTPTQPRRCVVQAHDRSQSESARVDAQFQRLTVPALEDA